MNILLTNVHSADNAGDQALMLESLHQIYLAYGDQTKITIVADDPDSLVGSIPVIQSMFGWLQRTMDQGKVAFRTERVLLLPLLTGLPLLVYRISGWLPARLLPAILQAVLQAYVASDAVISVGGGFLYSSARGVTLLIHAYSIFLAHAAGKPVYMLPQSFGPFRKPWECAVIRFVLGRARAILVREPVSMQQLHACRIPEARLHLIPDLGFSFSSTVPPALQETKNKLQAAISRPVPRLGITVIDWGAQFSDFSQQDVYELAMAEAAEYFCQETGGSVIFYPQVCGPDPAQDDRLPARRVAAHLKHRGDAVIVLEERYHPAVLKLAYAQMDVFLGTRMHSNIFALSEGVPVLAIGYLHKTRGIMQMFDLDEWVVDIKTITGEALVNKLGMLLKQQEAVARLIQERLPGIRSGILEVSKLIRTNSDNPKGQAG